jgi:hypothetical protein
VSEISKVLLLAEPFLLVLLLCLMYLRAVLWLFFLFMVYLCGLSVFYSVELYCLCGVSD